MATGKVHERDLAARLERLEKQLLMTETYSVSAFWQALDRAYALALPTRELRCIICDHTDRRAGFEVLEDRCMFGGGLLERYRCPQCGCVFGAQKYLDLDESFVDLDYRLLYSRYAESDSSDNEIRTFNSLKPRAGGLYLNWGSGGAWSSTISKLRAQGWDVRGFEPSAVAAGEFVVTERQAVPSPLDGLFSNNVIEHFRDPVEKFRDFHRLLKEGGVMAHSSPCYDYRYAFTRFHTLFLMGRSPEVLASRTGFSVVERIEDGEYVNLVFAKF